MLSQRLSMPSCVRKCSSVAFSKKRALSHFCSTSVNRVLDPGNDVSSLLSAVFTGDAGGVRSSSIVSCASQLCSSEVQQLKKKTKVKQTGFIKSIAYHGDICVDVSSESPIFYTICCNDCSKKQHWHHFCGRLWCASVA